MTTLYVIGNGFDLHHGMATSYKHFGEFLKRDHRELYNLLSNYFPAYDENDFWGHFEERLADFDADTLIEDYGYLVVPYGDDDWSDADHHAYAFELDLVVEALSDGLLSAFAEWIRQIVVPLPTSLPGPPARIDPTARFISFNYTDTLQRLYGVIDDQVWHIHGAAKGANSLVLGHGWRPKLAETWSASLDPEQEDTRVIDGAQIIDDYFKRSFKPTKEIIANNAARFAALADVDAIHVLGHSLSDVDLPYFKKIAACVEPRASWRISCFGASAALEAQFAKFASPALATFWSLPDV